MKDLSLCTAAGLVDSQLVAGALGGTYDLGRLGAQAPSAEGTWAPRQVEGKLPRDLEGSLYRIAPGQRVNHGVELRHLFDGDAYLVRYQFRDGKVMVSGHYVDTPERQEESLAGKMMFNEFGTAAPGTPRGSKNQPSINVIRWDDRLLGLSEGGHPSAIDPETLAFQQRWDFHGTLPGNIGFTAHPKFDNETGIGYGFGTLKGPSLALVVFRMELDGRLTELARLPQRSYFMIHDMLLGKEHIVFVAPPVHFDLPSLLTGKVAPGDALRYDANASTRLIVIRKDGTGSPVVFEQPANMVFHNGNLAESGGVLTVDSLLSPDDSILRFLYAWTKQKEYVPEPNRLVRLTLDLTNQKVAGRETLEESQEFPRFDTRLSGEAARYLYTLEEDKKDLFTATALVRHDLLSKTCKRVAAGKGRTLGEAVFVPRPGAQSETNGWLLGQGYDGHANETYLEIRDAGTLELEARVWTGQHFPLGFHGNFYQADSHTAVANSPSISPAL